MDKVETARRELLRDIESYSCGEQPSPIAMLRARRLEEWAVEIRRVGKEFKLVVNGALYGHPDHEDGGRVTTSAVVWFDRKMRWVRTHSVLYRLGQPAGEPIPLEGIEDE